MKKITLLILFLICAGSAFSQKVTVIDKSSLQPVKDAVLKSGSNTATTNSLGQTDISAFQNGDPITITSPDYFETILTYDQIKNMNFTIQMSDKSYRTDEVIISGNKFDQNSKYLPRQVEVLNKEDIKFANTQTTADLLQQTGNVFVQKSQLGGGSPILRGFEANKVLIMIDGVRLNNLIFRGGHLQNVLRVDENMLNRTEVLFGSGSTIYGSDALGGVMSFYTKDPVLSTTGKSFTTGSAFYRYSSADMENTGHFNLSFASNKVGFIGSVTYSNFNGLTMGTNDVKNQAWLRKYIQKRISNKDTMIATDNYYLQDPSGYNQMDIYGKVLISQSPNVSHTFNFQYSNTNDIPRYDRLNAINPSTGLFTTAQWYYGPETRILGSYKLGLQAKNSFYDNAKILLAYQFVEESRNSRNFQSNASSTNFNQLNLKSRTEKVNVYSVNADFLKKVSTSSLSYGLEFLYNTLKSSAFARNVNTLAEQPTDTRYPGGDNHQLSFSAYLQDLVELNKMIYMNAGLRYSYVGLSADFNDTTYYKFDVSQIDQNNSALSGNLGFTFLPKGDWRIYANGSTGYRTPNIDDMAKVFESVRGNVIIPNPDLGPEYTYGAEFGVSKIFDKWIRAEAIGYYTWIEDGITTQAYTYQGKDSIIYDGVLSKVYANQNALSGHIWGLNVNLNADLTENITMINTVNYTYGRYNTDSTDYPIDHIPPLFGKSGFVVNVNRFKAEANIIYNAWKLKKDYNMAGEDNFPDATPDGMPNWFTLNVSSAYQFNKYLQVQLDINNILDRNYRTFASGINAPGVNSVLSFRGNF